MLKLISTLANWPLVQTSALRLHQSPHILYYHMVRATRPAYYYQPPIAPKDFQFQLRWLQKNGFSFVSLSQLSQSYNQSDKRLVAVTTDDGFVENYTVLAPILDDFRIKATFFLIGNCINNKDMMWLNKLYMIESKIGRKKLEQQVYTTLKAKSQIMPRKHGSSLQAVIPMAIKEEIVNELWLKNDLPPLFDYLDENKPYLSGHQINELIAAGHTVGAHTMSHPRCNDLTREVLVKEIIGSIEFVRSTCAARVDFFAYPFGLRPASYLELEIFSRAGVHAFLGTKSSDSGFPKNVVWERDKMELPPTQSLFWFSIVPLLRRYILQPMGVYQ